MKRILAALAVTAAACGTSSPTPGSDAAAEAAADVVTTDTPPAPTPYTGPDDWCPGRDHCRGSGDNRLRVGAAKEDITPTIVETWTDMDMDGTYDANEPFMDANRNGEFDAFWLAGFGNGRAARGVNDPLEVRAIAFRYNDITVAWAVIDCVGFFVNEMDMIAADPTLRGLDIDKVIVSSTHVHEAVDTVGLWGRDLANSGRVPAYQALVRQRTAQALRRAVEAVRPVRVRVAQVPTVDAMGRTDDYVRDVRDPVIFDPTVTVAQFIDDAAPTRTVATLVNWASHPEYIGSRNNLLSADYVHWLRDTMEQGLAAESIPGLGGMVVFVNGALGGQVGPSGAHPRDRMGMMVRDAGFRKAELAGTNVARLALQALARDGMESREQAVSYRTAAIHARVENLRYGIAYSNNLFDRELMAFDRRMALSQTNPAWVRSRVTYLQVGPIAAITAPGELHPELWVGYDMRWSWGNPVLTEMRNRPDLAMAPRPPYLRDLMLANPGVRYAFVAGLTEDFLGYIVPRFNFVLHSGLPYLAEADGDHYEETNSIGPDGERHLHEPMMQLARWRAPMQ